MQHSKTTYLNFSADNSWIWSKFFSTRFYAVVFTLVKFSLIFMLIIPIMLFCVFMFGDFCENTRDLTIVDLSKILLALENDHNMRHRWKTPENHSTS